MAINVKFNLVYLINRSEWTRNALVAKHFHTKMTMKGIRTMLARHCESVSCIRVHSLCDRLIHNDNNDVSSYNEQSYVDFLLHIKKLLNVVELYLLQTAHNYKSFVFVSGPIVLTIFTKCTA